MRHFNIKVFGQVQGVFFRTSAKEMADALDIKGFARNEPDGTVYIEAEGEEENLKKFLEWCKEGPNFARVERVEVVEGEVKKFLGFETR